MRRLFLRPAHGARPGSGRRAFRAAAPEGLPVSENHLTEAAPGRRSRAPATALAPHRHPGSAAVSGRPFADKPAARRSVRRRRTPPPPRFVQSSALHLVRSERLGASALLRPKKRHPPAQSAGPRENISLISRNPCRKNAPLPERCVAKNDAAFSRGTPRKNVVSCPEACTSGKRRPVPDPNPFRGQVATRRQGPAHVAPHLFRSASARPRKTCHGKMTPVSVSALPCSERPCPFRHPHAVPQKDGSPLPEGWSTRTQGIVAPLPCRPGKRHALPHVFAFRPHERFRPPAAVSCPPLFAKGDARLTNPAFQH